MFGRTKVDPGQMTPAEKELLRQLMETPRVESDWDFFKDMSRNIPPPEFFIRGRPEPWWLRTVCFLLVAIGIGTFIWSVVLNWGKWLNIILITMCVLAIVGLVLFLKKYKQ